MSSEQREINVGDRIVLGDVIDEPRLSGASGVVIPVASWDGMVMRLDQRIPGFTSGTAWFTAEDVAEHHPAA